MLDELKQQVYEANMELPAKGLVTDVYKRQQKSCLHTRFPGSFGENQFSFGIIPKKREIFLSMNVLLHICSSMNV